MKGRMRPSQLVILLTSAALCLSACSSGLKQKPSPPNDEDIKKYQKFVPRYEPESLIDLRSTNPEYLNILSRDYTDPNLLSVHLQDIVSFQDLQMMKDNYQPWPKSNKDDFSSKIGSLSSNNPLRSIEEAINKEAYPFHFSIEKADILDGEMKIDLYLEEGNGWGRKKVGQIDFDDEGAFYISWKKTW